MSVVIANIGSLVTNDPSLGSGLLGEINTAAIVLDEGRVAWVGDSSAAPAADEQIDAGGHAVIPGFVDSHSHLLFAGDRSKEFDARMRGEKYTAGGINETVAATRAASDHDLETNMLSLVGEMTRSGITTWETKSGYGLTPEHEARALAIASRHTSETTFLGAHVVPKEYADDSDGYVSLILEKMLGAVSPSAKWIDVFCDRGAFDVDQARAILLAGISQGMQPRLHANQLANIGAVQLAVELGCASADHCTHLDSSDIDALAGSATVATLLPGAEFSTRAAYPDARRLFDAGVPVALATDCNPGSSFTTSMPFCIALAIREMNFTPEQALWAATMGGAQALRRSDVGTLSPGSRADLVVLNAPSYLHLGYRPGVDIIHSVMKAGSISYKGIA
ncbi:MAG: imidazolonepropionase [Actinobacteria bacterium]|uniref:imidazolonepropionase n=1 Tax=freshwater metagenome TaxID=449393 RepID=A0A6J6JXM5_9ZZZZ|nr:imidazolonepropionase [Actinomycetota bacterium]